MNQNNATTSTVSYGGENFKEFPVERLEMNKKKSFSVKLGSFCAHVIVAAITIGITAAIVALAAKFILWLF